MKKILTPKLLLLLVFSITVPGCARFLAAASGPEPVGVPEGERTLSQRVEDMSIERTASINLYKLNPEFAQSRVLVMSFYSNVLLAGQVSNESLKQMAGDYLKSLREVESVHNELIVAPVTLPYLTRAKDSIISARVRSALTFAKGFPSSQCKILVEDGVVYLMAKLDKDQADLAIRLIRDIPDVRKIVKLIDYLPDTRG